MRIHLIVLSIAALVLASCSQENPGANSGSGQSRSASTTQGSTSCNPQASFFADLLNLTNAERQSRGLGTLVIAQELVNAAQKHAIDMATNNFLSHTGSDGSTIGQRATREGYNYSALAENVAAGYGTPAAAVAGWMNSAGHRRNLLNPRYTEIGLGFANNPSSTYGNYWAQVFGDRPNSGSSIVSPVPASFLNSCAPAPDSTALAVLSGSYDASFDLSPHSGSSAGLLISHSLQPDAAGQGPSTAVPEPSLMIGSLVMLTGLSLKRRKT